MKIAIVGSHGVGKTTLSSKLSQIINLPIIPDIVVEAYNKGFTINEETPLETQFWLFAKQLELERNFNDKWIADKCLIDYSIYADILLKDQRAKELLSEMIMKNICYDHIFYLPIEFPIEDDGIRSTDPKFQRAIDERYRQILTERQIPYHILNGSVEARVKQALNIITDSFLN